MSFNINNKFLFSILAVVLALAFLINSAISNAAKKVMTVSQLVASSDVRNNIRLGARVSDSEIDYQTKPDFRLKFAVRDIHREKGEVVIGGDELAVVYHGIMPDTLKNGRDVILEGDFDGREFQARSLMTQCPSKYEPPLPEG